MQVDSAAPHHPQSSSPSPKAASSTLTGYAFPSAPRPTTADTMESTHHTSRYSPEASASASAEYAAPSSHANFAYDAGSNHASTPIPESHQQPRSMSMSGMVTGFEGVRPGSSGGGQMGGESEGYSALGRAISTGGQVQRVMSSFAFSEYMPNGGAGSQQQQQPTSPTSAGFYPPPPGSQSRFGPPPPHPQYASYQAQQSQHPYGHPPPHPGYSNIPSHGHPAGHDGCSGCLEEETARHHAIVNGSAEGRSPYGLVPGHRAYTPYPMARTTSSFSDSEASYNYGTSSHGEATAESTYGNAAYPSPYYGEAAYYGRPEVYRSLSGSETYGYPMQTSRSAPAASKRASTSSNKGKGGARGANRGIFHPSPQSMLAPGAVPSAGSLSSKGRVAAFPGTNSPGLPTEEDFARMPTKRSRGRRPPSTPDLLLGLNGEDPNLNPSEAQIRYCGLTKTGKPKKIFLCKVPDCGKVFRRSEHLKRHVRSIHTDEKPFQCQWPSCGRYFSRHDNLSQHLRVHRAPNQTDAEFSALLEQCFGPREDRRIPAHRQRDHLFYDDMGGIDEAGDGVSDYDD
ncbi:hypothetical protein BCR35DRAFT_96626 [Leucosporidium creatinivorum]|uniref:C2H2-type domain-containing protein n=1 Tax=Leucosporidium creatinivorum TaxID=106004 RepID=A0A1Y2F606_9BASI|nr:hypothetical protein BCR35DRAFT_96626 [Leucosporidium creatinivorum]